MTSENDTAMDPNALFREENFTDQKMGSIRKLIPVNADGSDDTNRPSLFFGAAQVMTQMGAIPLNFALDGETIGEAASDFAGKAQIAVEEASREIEKMRREQASKIVMPGQGGSGMGGSGGGIIT
ncbi:hypothetical protein OAC12_00775 [Porticoccaceae bacterium]|mgnify:FL=1|jgi:hypothetical protein|nr:hypothetical protein [Porticoccaceae bacterium]